jgi:ABC-type glycerol-3-phosphate transport system substrate-binding protein
MMTRALALLMLLLLAACGGLATAKTEATAFQNPQTGQVVGACGPMQGFDGAIGKAQQGCDQAYQAKGWAPLDGSVAALPE